MNTWLTQALAKVSVWAIHEPTLTRLVAMARDHEAASTDQIRALVADRMEVRPVSTGPGVAVIPIRGVIEPRRSLWTEYFGGTSVEGIRAQLRAALADETVTGIILDICSPGGDATGVDELATDLFKARGTKPIVAVCNVITASAAYWLAAQADVILGLQSAGSCGSIGVFTMHESLKGALDEAGIAVTFVQAGKYKTEANPYEPLSDEARAYLQAQVDTVYARFVAAVARGRGVTPAVVKATYGQGRCFLMTDAVAAGLVDRMGTFEDAVAKASTGRGRRADAETWALPADVLPVTVGSGDVAGATDRADQVLEVEAAEETDDRPRCACADACACQTGSVCEDDCPTCVPECPCVQPDRDEEDEGAHAEAARAALAAADARQRTLDRDRLELL